MFSPIKSKFCINVLILLIASLNFYSTIDASHPTGQHSAIAPAMCSEWAASRHAQVMQRAKDEPGDYDIEFIGDSITDYWEREGAKIWKEFYGHLKTINLGVTADRTQHVLWRLQNGQLDGINAKIAVVLIGTNNSKNSDNTAAEIVEGISAILQEIKTRQPKTKILLLGIFPRRNSTPTQEKKILEVNQMLATLQDSKTVFYLNIGSKFTENEGSVPIAIMPDGTHLSEAGYRIWASAMESKLQQLLGE